MNFYDSIIEGAQELSATDRGQLYVACLEYLYYGREPNFKMKAVPKAMFVMMRPVLDNQRLASENGKKGGRPRKKAAQKKQENDERKESETKGVVSETAGSEKGSVSENPTFEKSEQEQEYYLSINNPSGNEDSHLGGESYLTENSSGANLPVGRILPPPSLEDVKSYCDGNGLNKCDPTLFFAYYESQGWLKPNGMRVTNWQALAVQWNQQDRNEEASRIVKNRTGRDFSAFSSENWETL